MMLPPTSAAPATATDRDPAAFSDRPVPTVLLVDDTAAVRSLLRRVLERLGYAVTEAPGGEEALAAVQAHRFDAMLLDYHLGSHRGDAVYHAACDLQPALARRTVFISGDPAAARCYPATVERCTVLEKPFGVADLAAALAFDDADDDAADAP